MKKDLIVGRLIKQCVENPSDGSKSFTVERILWVDPDYTLISVINVCLKSGVPEQKIIQDIEDSIEEGYASLIDDTELMSDADLAGYISPIRFCNDADLTEKEKQIRDKAWKIVSSLASPEHEPAIYYRSLRGKLIKAFIKEYNSDKGNGERLTERLVYLYLRRFWQRGKTRNALLPDYINSGGKGKPKAAGEKKRGRPRKYAFDPKIGSGINITDEDKKIFKAATNAWYNTKKENSLKYVFRRMRANFYKTIVERDDENNEKTRLRRPGEKPSYAQFLYWHNEEFDIRETIKARKGQTAYERNHRAIVGNSTLGISGPGYKFQIDATLGDVYLLSRYNANWIIGRPVIYLVVDVYSRMIVGVYVGLEGPSWLGMMMALLNTTTNKVHYCKKYGIDIKEEDWSCSSLPKILCGDNGELLGKAPETLANNLNVEIENVAAFRPDWKAFVERLFRTIQHEYVKPEAPGFVIKDQREGSDYVLDAKLTVESFTRIIIKCIGRHNKRQMKPYIRDQEMIADDNVSANPTPLELWKWGIENRSGQHNFFPEDIIKLNLLPTGRATIKADGIHFKGKRYTCAKADAEDWFVKARNKRLKEKYLEVSYDLQTSDYIYIRDADGRGFEKCVLKPTEERYFGVSVEEVEHLLACENYDWQRSEDYELDEDGKLFNEIGNVLDMGMRIRENRDDLNPLDDF